MGVGLVCAAVKLFGDYTLYWEGAAVICSAFPNNSFQPPRDAYFSSRTAWNDYNCTTQCGSLSPNLILRPGTQMVPNAQPEFQNGDFNINIPSKISMTQLSQYVLPFVILQYIYALWSDRRSPAEARDRVCALIARSNRNRQHRIRTIVAVGAGLGIYIHALLTLLVCPLLFFFNILFNEIGMVYSPQDEPVTAVGQWSPVVSTLLVVTSSSAQIRSGAPTLIRHFWSR